MNILLQWLSALVIVKLILPLVGIWPLKSLEIIDWIGNNIGWLMNLERTWL